MLYYLLCHKDKNNYCYNIFLQKSSYELPKKFLYKILMTYYVRIDVYEGFDGK